jgi:hypothetical protein
MTPAFFHSSIWFSGFLTLFLALTNWVSVNLSFIVPSKRPTRLSSLYGLFDGSVVFGLLFSLLREQLRPRHLWQLFDLRAWRWFRVQA